MSNLQKNEEGGFTVVELLVAAVISLIILGVAFSMFDVQRKTFSVQEQLSEMQQNVRAAMDMMVREIRMTGYDPLGTNFAEIGSNTATTFQIFADLDGDGTSTSANEDIIYSYDAANLLIDRDTGGGGQAVAENIANLTFSYFDVNDNTTATAADIRKVQIAITGRTANIDPDSGNFLFGTQTSFVTPKNLGY